MQLSQTRFFAGMAIAALGAVSLFAQQTPAPVRGHGHGRRMHQMTRQLNLTPDQQAQAKSIFQAAGQSSKPIRQQMRIDRAALQTAVKAGDTNQIQQLTASIGNEQGQLAASRATAFSKFYKTLTPDQQQKLDAFQQNRHTRRGQTPQQN
jgi:protein CpxP